MSNVEIKRAVFDSTGVIYLALIGPTPLLVEEQLRDIDSEIKRLHDADPEALIGLLTKNVLRASSPTVAWGQERRPEVNGQVVPNSVTRQGRERLLPGQLLERVVWWSDQLILLIALWLAEAPEKILKKWQRPE